MAESADPAFVPFADEAGTYQLGAFSIENGTTELVLHGSLSITRDRAGLERAHSLKALVDRIVANLEAADLPAVVAQETTAIRRVPNPFA